MTRSQALRAFALGLLVLEVILTAPALADGINGTVGGPVGLFVNNGVEALHITTAGDVGIGSTSPVSSFDLSRKTDAVALPVGTTSQRPGTALNGMIRYNTDNGKFEGYQANAWQDILTGGAVGSTIYLGTGTGAANPQRNGEASTGLYTAGSGLVDVTSSGTQITEFGPSGFNIVTGGLSIGTQNGISYPAAETNSPKGSIAIGSSALAGMPTMPVGTVVFGDTAIGYQTLSSATMTTAARGNTALGYQALKVNTSGSGNTAMGYGTMIATTSGANNTAVGYSTLPVNTTGQLNVAIGGLAMQTNTVGQQNVAVGVQSGSANLNGVYNTAIGHQALMFGSSGSYNTGIGGYALGSNVTGSGNIALGAFAGSHIGASGGGSNNVAIGSSVASTTLTTGSHNILIGTDNTVDSYSAGTSNAIAIGHGAKSGSGDIAIGYQAYATPVADSTGNIAIGSQALGGASMTTAAINNTAVGYQTLKSMTSGSSNVAIGYLAGKSLTSGSGETAIGANALATVAGDNNTAVGAAALNLATGINNTALGAAALGFTTNSTGSTGLGYRAGRNITTGSQNVAIGYQVATTTLTTGSNNILIGTNSTVDTPAAGTNNFLNIGNVIYGTSIGTQGQGLIGIGSTSPVASLDLSQKTDAVALPVGTNGARPGSPLDGMIRYNSATPAVEAYYNSAWNTISAGGNTPSAFSFTNQTSVTTSSTISSNAVTLTGFTGTVSATCGAGCTAIARNGVWGGTTVAGFQSGDTIAIRLTSSASLNTAVTATVTAGTTVSGTWSVTTNSSTPNAFSFTDVTGATTSWTYCSNAVTLAGFTGSVTGICNSGCNSITRNSVYGGSSVTGFVSGDTIKICTTASSSASTAVTASVTVGATTSSTWTVTTGTDSCPGVTTVGTTCPDGTVYAGVSVDGNVKAYVTPCDAGQSLSGSCTGTRITKTWNNGTASFYTTGYTNSTTGKANTTGLHALGPTSDSPYNAADYCATLSAFGHSDWYLPAYSEALNSFWNATNAPLIGGFDTSLTYSSSTEVINSQFTQLLFTGGAYNVSSATKTASRNIRCMRHD